MKKIFIASMLALFALPFVADAQSYYYINMSGKAVPVEANSSSEALLQAQARGDILRSGVRPAVDGLIVAGWPYAMVYAYVDRFGLLRMITAENQSVAYSLAIDRAPTSGLITIGHSQAL